MNAYLNNKELLPALFRAMLAFGVEYLIFTGKVKSAGRVMDLEMNIMIGFLVYVILTLALPRVKPISIAIFIVDTLLLMGVVWISGKGESYFAFAIPLLVISSALRIGPALAAIPTVCFVLCMWVMTAFDPDVEFFRFLFWLFYIGSFYLLMVLILAPRRENSGKFEMLYVNMERTNSELERRIVEMEQKLQTYTIYDTVSGLKNFRYFRVRVEEEMSRAARLKYPFCLCVLGIDDFQEFETQYGAQERDRAIQKLAQALQKCVRDTDMIAKYTSDQFLMLLPQANPRQALIPTLRIKSKLDALTFGPNNTFTFTFSFGIAGYPDDVRELGGLFTLAGAALERSHERGPGSITLASSLFRAAQ